MQVSSRGGWRLLRKLVIGVSAEYTLMPEPQSENTFWSKEISSCEKILPRLGSSSATAILLIAAWIGTSHAAAPQGAVKSVHGDWQVRCDSPPGTQENQCALVQSVTAEDRPDVGLIIICGQTRRSEFTAPARRRTDGRNDFRRTGAED